MVAVIHAQPLFKLLTLHIDFARFIIENVKQNISASGGWNGRISDMNTKVEGPIPPWLSQYLSAKFQLFLKNINFSVENGCLYPYTLTISNAKKS